MRVQIIQDHANALRGRVGFLHQPAHLVRKVLTRALRGHRDMALARQRLKMHKQVARPLPLILVIVARRLSRFYGQGDARFGDELDRLFVKTHHGPLRIVGFGVQVQHVFHRRHKGCVYGAKAPRLFLPRLEVVFLSTRRMVSCETESTICNATNRPANARKVQRVALRRRAQAVAITTACLCYRLWAAAQGVARECSWRTALHKPLANALHRCPPTSSASAMRSSFQPAGFEQIRDRASLRAEVVPLRTSACSSVCSSALRRTWYLRAGIGASWPPTIPAVALPIKSQMTDH
jgi:hypothetical protein